VKLNTKILASGFKQTGNQCEISLKNTQLINAGKYLTLQIS